MEIRSYDDFVAEVEMRFRVTTRCTDKLRTEPNSLDRSCQWVLRLLTHEQRQELVKMADAWAQDHDVALNCSHYVRHGAHSPILTFFKTNVPAELEIKDRDRQKAMRQRAA